MEYTSNKVDGQELMFAITTTHNGEEITFNVVCAADESEIPDLVAHHIDFLENPPVVQAGAQAESQDLNSIVQQQQAIIESLTTRIAALEGAQ